MVAESVDLPVILLVQETKWPPPNEWAGQEQAFATLIIGHRTTMTSPGSANKLSRQSVPVHHVQNHCSRRSCSHWRKVLSLQGWGHNRVSHRCSLAAVGCCTHVQTTQKREIIGKDKKALSVQASEPTLRLTAPHPELRATQTNHKPTNKRAEHPDGVQSRGSQSPQHHLVCRVEPAHFVHVLPKLRNDLWRGIYRTWISG